MLFLLLLLAADSFDTSFRAGLIALSQNNLPLAESELEAASRMQPRDARVWLALAQTYSKLSKKPLAENAAQKAEQFASEGALLHGLSIYYAGAQNFAKAAELEERYAESMPAAAAPAVELYLRAQQPERAAALARKAALAEPLYFEVAQALLKQERFPQTLEVLAAGQKNFPSSAQLQLAVGVAYYGLRRFPEAIDAFLKTITLNPAVEQPYVFLGRMLDQAQNKRAQIAAAFAAFARNSPESALSNFLYGKVLSLEDPAKAETHLRKSIARSPEQSEPHFELGVLLERKGNLEEASKEIRRASELSPKDPAPHYRLARIYDRLGRASEAKAERAIHAGLTGGNR